MSSHIFIVDKKEKLLIDCGNISEDLFMQECEMYKELRNTIIDYGNSEELDEIKYKRVKDLTTKDLKIIVECIETMQDLSSFSASILALDYWYRHSGNNDLELIWEGHLYEKRFKGYTYVS